MINKNVLEKGLRAEFLRNYQSGPTYARALATIVGSTSDSEKYPWLGDAPTMEEFIDERTIKGLSEGDYSIKNKKFAATLAVKRDSLADDQVGGYLLRAQEMGIEARVHPDELLFQVLEDGDDAVKGKTYDGVAFFHTAHPIRGEQTATQSNKLTGTGVTTAALKTDLGTAIATLRKIKNERNKPMNRMIESKDLVVVCPPDIEFAMKEALTAAIISNTSNVMVGTVGSVIVSPRLTDANDWHLLYTGRAIKPFILQEREAMTFEELTEGDDAFKRETYYYGPRARYNVGYGLWQTAVMVSNA